jgi:hypothetical protein
VLEYSTVTFSLQASIEDQLTAAVKFMMCNSIQVCHKRFVTSFQASYFLDLGHLWLLEQGFVSLKRCLSGFLGRMRAFFRELKL